MPDLVVLLVITLMDGSDAKSEYSRDVMREEVIAGHGVRFLRISNDALHDIEAY